MGLERYLSRIGPTIAKHLGDPLPYVHVATGTATTVTGFLKHVSSIQDPIDRPTKRQKIPVIRVQGLPWGDDEVGGDTVDCEGRRWSVVGALARPSGWTDLYVANDVPIP